MVEKHHHSRILLILVVLVAATIGAVLLMYQAPFRSTAHGHIEPMVEQIEGAQDYEFFTSAPNDPAMRIEKGAIPLVIPRVRLKTILR